MPIGSGQEGPAIIYKPLLRYSELLEHFHLRHQVFLDCGYRKRANTDLLDVDRYDLRAIHLGAFQVGTSIEQVGGVRLIFQRGPVQAREHVRRILLTTQSAELRAVPHDSDGLPSLASFDYSKVCQERGYDVHELVEFSRTFCLPQARGRQVGGSLVVGILTMGHLSGAPWGIGSCEATAAPFYERGGCEVLGAMQYPGMNHASAALGVPLQPLMPAIREGAALVGRALNRYGMFCNCLVAGVTGCDCISHYHTCIEQPAVQQPAVAAN